MFGDQTDIKQFAVAYQQELAEELSIDRFRTNDVYAFQAIQRALMSTSTTLRRLAAALMARRAEAMKGLATNRVTDDSPAARQEARASSEERREAPPRHPMRFDEQQTRALDEFRFLFAEEFGEPFDEDMFASDDRYGRTVLLQSLVATNPALVQVARLFMDKDGYPIRHRRSAVLDGTDASN